MPWSYRPALDGLRSVAVYLVLLFHAGIAAVGGGFIGVDLFFVLSGFLVSNVILSEIDKHGTLDLGRFYSRRIRRLLPAAVLVIVATAVMFLIVTSVVRRLPLVQDAQSSLLYVANWNFLFRKNDYFAIGVDESPFLHFWSLAIEEQFYFVFPVVLLLLSKAVRRRSGAMLATLVGLFALSLGSQLYWAGADANWAYYGTDARLYQLLAGAILAVLLRSATSLPTTRVAGVGALIGLGSLLVLGSSLLELTPSVRGIGATLASVTLIGGLMLSETALLGRMLSLSTLVYLGQISYGTYLWHWPVILLLEELLAVPPLVVAALAIVFSTSLAALSHQLLEMPIRTAPLLHRFTWTTVVAGVAASAVVAVTVVPMTFESAHKPRLVASGGQTAAAAGTGVTAGERNAPVPTDIDFASLLGGTGDQPNCTPQQPDACTIVEGDGPHVALVGDSHAKMLTPMFVEIAQEHDLTLSVNADPSCPWQAGVANLRLTRARDRACQERRGEWYQKVLPELDPDLVVLSSIARDSVEYWGGKLVRSDGSDEPLSELNLATMSETVDLIESTGSRVLIIDSLPVTGGEDPLECLATATRMYECEVTTPEQMPASDAYYRVVAERSEMVFNVNVNSIFCKGAPQCLPIVDGLVVWRDNNHLSTQITRHFRGQVWDRIAGSGALQGL